MFRAVEMFRWGAGAWLVAGCALVIAGLTEGDPRADQFAAVLGVLSLGGLACAVWWVVRRLSRVTVADVAESSIGQRVWRIAIVCAAPALLLVSGVLFTSQHTWVLGITAIAGAVSQLTFAAVAARLEHRHGARVLYDGSQRFFLVR